MYEIGEQVVCKESSLIGTVLDKEWERGWQYTIITKDKKYFYRDGTEIKKTNK